MHTVFTIGYSGFELNEFIAVLKQHGVSALADVRSMPYSRFKPEFNQDNLTVALFHAGIRYVFLGKECGARVEDPSCIVDGKVNYNLVAESPVFKQGLQRILTGSQKGFQVALMCAEKDPITCHRTILVSRNLNKYPDISVVHILGDGTLEKHEDAERRLMAVWKMTSLDLFKSPDDLLKEAYTKQGNKIAYRVDDEKPDGEE